MTKIFVDYYKTNNKFILNKQYEVKYVSERSYIIKDETGFYIILFDEYLNFITIEDYRNIQLNKS